MRRGEILGFHQHRTWIGAPSLSVCLILLATPARTQETPALKQETLGASSLPAEQSPRADQQLQFESVPESAVREGYLTLTWNDVAGAVAYDVREADDLSYYRGAASQAFVSGLSDGTYNFQVSAVAGTGRIIATSDTVTVVVQHWPLSYAYGLFTVGLLVVMSVLVVIVRGAVRTAVPDGGQS